MNLRAALVLLPALVLAAAPLARAAAAKSDIVPAQRRQTVVETAERLTRRPVPPPVPADRPNPFNPADFDLPDPDAPKPAGAAPRPGAGPAQPAAPSGDREILESLAQRLNPSGMFMIGGRPLLVIDRNRFEVGTKFIVTFNDKDYELELVAIDRTTFTLRYRNEEITRPIKPVR